MFTKFGPAALVGGDYQGDMLPFAESLTDEEIWATIAFIKSQWPEAIRKRHAAAHSHDWSVNRQALGRFRPTLNRCRP